MTCRGQVNSKEGEHDLCWTKWNGIKCGNNCMSTCVGFLSLSWFAVLSNVFSLKWRPATIQVHVYKLSCSIRNENDVMDLSSGTSIIQWSRSCSVSYLLLGRWDMWRRVKRVQVINSLFSRDQSKRKSQYIVLLLKPTNQTSYQTNHRIEREECKNRIVRWSQVRNPRACVSMMWVHLIDISIESTCNFIKEEVVLLKWFLGMLKSNQTSLEGHWFNYC